MEFSEKNIEDLICDCIDTGNFKKLRDRGLYALKIYDKYYRQVNLSGYGRLDLVGVSYRKGDQEPGSLKRLNIGVIEIKKGEINYNTFIQAVRYCKGIEQYLYKRKWSATFNIFLIGSSVCKSDFCYMADFVDNLRVYSIHLDIEKGITFKSERGYSLVNQDVNIGIDVVESIKDYVLEVVKTGTYDHFSF